MTENYTTNIDNKLACMLDTKIRSINREKIIREADVTYTNALSYHQFQITIRLV